MKTEADIKLKIKICWEEIDLIRNNKDLKYPFMQELEIKKVIAMLYWVLDDPSYDVWGSH